MQFHSAAFIYQTMAMLLAVTSTTVMGNFKENSSMTQKVVCPMARKTTRWKSMNTMPLVMSRNIVIVQTNGKKRTLSKQISDSSKKWIIGERPLMQANYIGGLFVCLKYIHQVTINEQIRKMRKRKTQLTSVIMEMKLTTKHKRKRLVDTITLIEQIHGFF